MGKTIHWREGKSSLQGFTNWLSDCFRSVFKMAFKTPFTSVLMIKTIPTSQSCCLGRQGRWRVPGSHAATRLFGGFGLFGKEADSASPLLQCQMRVWQKKTKKKLNCRIWVNSSEGGTDSLEQTARWKWMTLKHFSKYSTACVSIPNTDFCLSSKGN